MSDTFDELFDQRRHRRVAAGGQARINFGGRWHNCQVVDLSGGGGRFRSKIKPIQGANVLIQLRGVGIVRARVVDRDVGTFALSFNQKDYDVDAMVDNLMLQANAKLMAGESAMDVDAVAEKDTEGNPNAKQSKANAKEERESEKFLKENTGKRLRAMMGR